MSEETGLNTSVKRLLYVADKPEDNLLHIAFELQHNGGMIQTLKDGWATNARLKALFAELGLSGN